MKVLIIIGNMIDGLGQLVSTATDVFLVVMAIFYMWLGVSWVYFKFKRS